MHAAGCSAHRLVVPVLAHADYRFCQRVDSLPGISHWVSDRLLEADLVDASGLVALPTLPPLPPDAAAGWATLAGGAAVLLARLVWDAASSLQALARSSSVRCLPVSVYHCLLVVDGIRVTR